MHEYQLDLKFFFSKTKKLFNIFGVNGKENIIKKKNN